MRCSIQWMRQRLGSSVIALGQTYGRIAVTRLVHALTPRIGQGSLAMPPIPPSLTCMTDWFTSYRFSESAQRSVELTMQQISMLSKRRRIDFGVDWEYDSAAVAVRIVDLLFVHSSNAARDISPL